jgi:general secretion pathway protein J
MTFGLEHKRPLRQSGFTLIEIIVAMTLISLIMMLIYSGINSSRRLVEKGEKRITATNEVRVVQELLRRQISRALPLAFKQNDDGEFILFEGDRDHILYVAPMPGYLGTGGPHVQLVQLVNDAGGKTLQFKHWLLSDAFDPKTFLHDQEQEPVILLEHLKSGEFSFVGLDEEGEVTDWQGQWQEAGKAPLMVRLAIESDQRSPVRWPEFQVALKLDNAATRSHIPLHLLLQDQPLQ